MSTNPEFSYVENIRKRPEMYIGPIERGRGWLRAVGKGLENICRIVLPGDESYLQIGSVGDRTARSRYIITSTKIDNLTIHSFPDSAKISSLISGPSIGDPIKLRWSASDTRVKMPSREEWTKSLLPDPYPSDAYDLQVLIAMSARIVFRIGEKRGVFELIIEGGKLISDNYRPFATPSEFFFVEIDPTPWSLFEEQLPSLEQMHGYLQKFCDDKICMRYNDFGSHDE